MIRMNSASASASASALISPGLDDEAGQMYPFMLRRSQSRSRLRPSPREAAPAVITGVRVTSRRRQAAVATTNGALRLGAPRLRGVGSQAPAPRAAAGGMQVKTTRLAGAVRVTAAPGPLGLIGHGRVTKSSRKARAEGVSIR